MFILGSNRVDDGSNIYTKQIHPYGQYVYAEIIYQDKDTDREKGPYSDLWYFSMSKRFGRTFRNEPREKDYIDAHKWADEQLELLRKYGTKKLSRAKCLDDENFK